MEAVNKDYKYLRKEDRFYALLSKHMNYMDEDTVRKLYSGLVRLIGTELKEYGYVQLPYIGEFYLYMDDQPATFSQFKKSPLTGLMVKMPTTHTILTTLKFKINSLMSKHIKGAVKITPPKIIKDLGILKGNGNKFIYTDPTVG